MTIREQVEHHKSELLRLKVMLDLAFGPGAKASQAIEDRVVFPLGVACRDILEEILFAVDKGYGRLALRSCRTMYECAVFSRYIRLHPDKGQDFLKTFFPQWAKIIQNLPESSRRGATEMHETLTQKVPKYAQGKLVSIYDLNWSGETTLEMAKTCGALAGLHSIAFDYASAYVHPTIVFFINQMSQTESEERFYVGEKSQETEAEQALRVAHDLILNAADLRLKYSPSDGLRERLDKCIKDFIQIWGYSPHL